MHGNAHCGSAIERTLRPRTALHWSLPILQPPGHDHPQRELDAGIWHTSSLYRALSQWNNGLVSKLVSRCLDSAIASRHRKTLTGSTRFLSVWIELIHSNSQFQRKNIVRFQKYIASANGEMQYDRMAIVSLQERIFQDLCLKPIHIAVH